MSVLMKTLRTEISRLARRETKTHVRSLHKSSGAARRTLADLKRRVAALERQLQASDTLRAPLPAAASVGGTAARTRRISGKAIRGLRQKLGLSQGTFAKLVGVTPHGVYLWEHKVGIPRMREAPRKAVQALRKMTPRQVKARLSELGLAPAPRARGAGGK